MRSSLILTITLISTPISSSGSKVLLDLADREKYDELLSFYFSGFYVETCV